MRRFLIIAAACFLAGTVSCGRGRIAPSQPSPLPEVVVDRGDSPRVRVLVLEDSGRISIETEKARLSAVAENGGGVKSMRVSGTLVVERYGQGVKVSGGGRILVRAENVMISPGEGSFFRINGKPYRGELSLLNQGGGKILAVNILDIDDYIKGVLPAEIGYLRKGQYEAYRVQAIASRSYAISKLEEKRNALYDLRSTIMDQVYKGVEGENDEASRAVEETKGMVGLWKGEPIKAYYSSCCGGFTADIRTGWPWKAPFPYLYGSRDAAAPEKRSFCRDSRHFRWDVSWSGRDLVKILKKTLPAELGSRVASFSRLIDIRVEGISRSGRVETLKVVTDNGTYEVKGDRIRWVLRPDSAGGPILRSTLFKMRVDRDRGRVSHVTLKGGGNGHGTGMCQSGAIKMAELGYSAREILLHYYPGITIKRIYKEKDGH